jgi:hypothetical protein
VARPRLRRSGLARYDRAQPTGSVAAIRESPPRQRPARSPGAAILRAYCALAPGVSGTLFERYTTCRPDAYLPSAELGHQWFSFPSS